MGWMFVSTAIPEIFMMVLGAATYTFLSDERSVGRLEWSESF